MGKKSLKSNPRYVIEFYKRVLSEKSCVQVLAVNELPFGCKGGQAPKVIWEIFCSDPERRDLEVTRGMPVAVLYVRFREDYARAHVARHSSVRCIHIAFCRLPERFSPDMLERSEFQGVETCENLWVKVNEMEDKVHAFHCVQVRDSGWKWRQIWESTMHCSHLYAPGANADTMPCWTPKESATPLKSGLGPGVFLNCDHVCEENLAFAAVRTVLNEAVDTLSYTGPEIAQGKRLVRKVLDPAAEILAHPIVSHENMRLDGLCLPITSPEHIALDSYQNVAILFSFQQGPGAREKSGMSYFCEHLESLHWKTILCENAKKIDAERLIAGNINSARFRKGANLYLFIGNVVKIRRSTYIMPDSHEITASFRHNRVDWEEEVKFKAFSIDWLQEQLGAVREYGAPPVFIIVESDVSSGDIDGNLLPSCKQRTFNSMVVRCFRDRKPQLASVTQDMENRRAGSQFLARLQYLIIQKGIDVRDVLMRIHSGFEGERSEYSISLDYDGLRQNYFFHPELGQARSHEVEPEDRLSIAQSFGSPFMWGAPLDALAGRPELLSRKVRLPSLGGSANDFIDYLESRCQESHFCGKYMVHGDHGVGKSTMTAALAHRLYWKRSCSAVFWANGGNSTQLYHDLLSLAKYLGLVDDKEDMLEAVIARLRNWMTAHPGWFFVLEDVADEAVVDLLDFPLSFGMLLVTSRPAQWKSIPWQNVVELTSLFDEEGHPFVLRIANNDTPVMVDALLKESHHHPLTVAVALSFTRQQRCRIQKFLAAKKPADLLAEMHYCAVGMTNKERGFFPALMSVMVPVMNEFRVIDKKLSVMLVACACCHANGIHRSIFEGDPNVDKHFDVLIRYEILKVSGDATFHMNPLLQLSIREHFAAVTQPQEGEPTNLKEAGLQYLCNLLERGMASEVKDSFLNNLTSRVVIRPERSAWLVHVLEAESLGGSFSWPFLRACGNYMAINMHEYDEPLRLFRTLLERCSRNDTDYPRFLSVTLHVGETHMRRKEYHEGLFQLEQFLQMFEHLGCQHDGVFVKVTSLVGDCLRAQGKYADALNRYEHALYTCKKFPDLSAPVGEKTQAEGWFDFFLGITIEMIYVTDDETFPRLFVMELSKGTDIPVDRLKLIRVTPNTLQSPFQEMEPGVVIVEMKVKNDIEWTLPEGKRKSPVQLIKNIQQMSQDKEPKQGKPNPLKQGKLTTLIDFASCALIEGGQTRIKLVQADILCKIGDVMTDLEDLELAKSKYNEALHMQRSANESEHVCIADTMFKIAEVCSRQGNMDRALEALQECRAMRARLVGHDHRSIAQVYALQGRIYEQQGQFQQSVLSLDRAKRIYRACLGQGSWEVAQAAVSVGMAQDQLGQWDSANAEYGAAVKIFEAFKDSVNVARCLNNMGVIHRKQRDYATALELFSKAKMFLSKVQGENNLEFAGVVRNIGSVHFEKEQWKQAQDNWETALKLTSECGHKESVESALTMLNLGSVHMKMSRYNDAHGMYGQAYALLIKLLGSQHVDTARALAGLGICNAKLGDLDHARGRLENALVVFKFALGSSHLEVCDIELNLAAVLLEQATAKTTPQEDGAFPMSAALSIKFNKKKIKDLGELQDSQIFKTDLTEEIAEILGVNPAQVKISKFFPERNVVELRVYRGSPQSATPAHVVKTLIQESSDKGSKLYQGKLGSKVLDVTGLDNESSMMLNEAMCLYQHVIKVRTDKYGADDLDVGNAMRCRGNIYMVSADRSKAIAEYWRALRIFEMRLGKDHEVSVSTCSCIERALEEELVLATRNKEQKVKATNEAAKALALLRSKAREAIKEACEEAEEEAIKHLDSVTRRLEECKRWSDPNPFSYTPVRKRMLRTRRFKVYGSEFGPENRGKFGTVLESAHDNLNVSVKLDNGFQTIVSGIEFEQNAFYVLPEGLEVGRKLVITGLVQKKKYNGLHGHIQDVHKTDPHRVIVVAGELQLEVKFENCEFALPSAYHQGDRVKIVNLSAANAIYNGGDATIVRAFDQDVGRILVRLDNGSRMCAVKLENIESLLPKGYVEGCRIATHGLKKNSLNNRYGKVERPDETDIERAIVYLEPVGEQTVGSLKSISYKNLRFTLPEGLEVGRAVLYNSMEGHVARADELDSALVVAIFKEKNKTGQMVDTEQAVPLRECVLQLPANLNDMMSVILKDLKTKRFNDARGFIRGSAPHDPERVVVELEDGTKVQVKQRNFNIIG